MHAGNYKVHKETTQVEDVDGVMEIRLFVVLNGFIGKGK